MIPSAWLIQQNGTTVAAVSIGYDIRWYRDNGYTVTALYTEDVVREKDARIAELERLLENARQIERNAQVSREFEFQRAERLAAENTRLREVICQAAVPLEGLRLAAAMGDTDLGMTELAWSEINNAISCIREAIQSKSEGA